MVLLGLNHNLTLRLVFSTRKENSNRIFEPWILWFALICLPHKIWKLFNFVADETLANIFLPRICMNSFSNEYPCGLIYDTCCSCSLASWEAANQHIESYISRRTNCNMYELLAPNKLWKFGETPFMKVVVQSYTFLLGCIELIYVNMQRYARNNCSYMA